MNSVINRFAFQLYRVFIRVGHGRLRRELLRCDDRLLADAGFSRQLLEEGVGAWPWREVGLSADPAPGMERAEITRQERRQAIKELGEYNDADLADLGIARANIEDAVRYGRPGIDQPPREAA